MIKIFKHRAHAHRTPLSYAALAPLFADFITLVDRPAQADLYLFAHSLDVEAAPRALVEDWRARFAARATDVTFMFERWPEPFHDVHWPEGGIIGLCAWRTRLAEACTTGVVERLGTSWQGGPSRFELDNWYLDKMTRLDGRSRNLAAFENTHQPRLHHREDLRRLRLRRAAALFRRAGAPDSRHRPARPRLGQPAWRPPAGGRQADLAAQFPPERFEAYAAAQRQLHRLFGTPGLWVAERSRLRQAVRDELTAVLDRVPVA